MAVELFTDGIEPEADSVIWRFLQFWKFEDLLRHRRLYFRRADLFPDESEGLPPEEYRHVLGLHPLDVLQRRELDHSIGSLAQFREAFFINCWHLFREETCEMWKEYGADGVAVVSRYTALKSGLDGCGGRPHLGLVRYGSAHLTGWNVQRFISPKQLQYAHEREVRAALWILDPSAGVNRHFDTDNKPHDRPLTKPPGERVPDGVTRVVDVGRLVTDIVLSPWMPEGAEEKVAALLQDCGLAIATRPSELTRYRALLPCEPPAAPAVPERQPRLFTSATKPSTMSERILSERAK